jgi:PAS domain S-box-containing protein
VNLTGAHMLGIARSRLVNRRFGVFLAEGDRRAFSDFLQKAFASHVREHFEVTLHREGSRPIFLRIEVTVSNDGQECRAMMLDFTERRQAEEKVRAAQDETERLLKLSEQSRLVLLSKMEDEKEATEELRNREEKFRALFEQAVDIILLLEIPPRGIPIIREANPAAYRLLGYERDELLGQPLTFISAEPQAEDRILERRSKLLLSRMSMFEAKHRRKDGTVFEVECTVREIQVGSKTMAFSVERDITERKRAAEALLDSEDKFKRLFEESPASIALVDTKGIIREANLSLLKVLAINREDLIGNDFLTIAATFGVDDQEQIADFRERLAGGKPANELTFLNRDGKRKTIAMQSSTFGSGGKVTGVLFMVQDITERKRAEGQIHKDLEEKNVMLKEIHHRVKNNLNIITSLLNLQANRITDKSQALAAFEESKNRVYAMALIHESLYKEQDFSHVNLKSFIENMTQNLLRVYQSSTKIEIHVENVAMDLNNAIPCGLILNELVTNALKHAFQGNHKERITIGFCELKDKTFELTVQDNGIGLPIDVDIRKAKSLGLIIVSRLIEQIDGVLTITRSKGTKFRIKFPVIMP